MVRVSRALCQTQPWDLGFFSSPWSKGKVVFFHVKLQMERLLFEASKPWKFLNITVTRLQHMGKHSLERGGAGTWGGIPPRHWK